MVCCLNPHCDNPLNPDNIKYCQSCGEAIVPLLLNRFKVIKVLGRGGFGKTYLAQDTHRLDESCVVKQLLPNTQGTWAKKKAIELFKLEAQQLQKLGEHPHIPHLYANFEQDGYFYLVQQFIKGQDLLKELEEDGVWKEEEVKEFLLELLPVLQFIHERRVIHRDIKLANIMRRRESLMLNQSSTKVGKSGDLVLIDFGVSKQLSNTIVTTAEGTIIGSHGYAAMEQMQGGKAYPASDLFSLGATCVHLLTNIHPYQLFLEAGYGWTEHWRNSLPSQVSNQLSRVIDKLLQKDIEERYQSSQDVINDLKTSVVPSPSPLSKPKISAKSGEEALNLPESVELNPVPNQTEKSSTYSPFSGFFYLFALFGITALFAIFTQYVPWYVLPEIIIGAILALGIMVVLQLKQVKQTERLKGNNQTEKPSTSSPFSGFFYLFALFGITALFAIFTQYVPWYVLPEIIIGAILAMGIVRVLQLKQMGVLSEESFVKAIQDILEKLSLVRSGKSSKETLEEETLDVLDNDQ